MQENKLEHDFYKEFAAEFVGTAMLVFTVGCNLLCGNPVWAVTSIACSLMVMIYALGSVSGANFNPAVTFALGLLGHDDFSTEKVLKYMSAQFIGGAFGAVCYSLLFHSGFPLAPGRGYGFLDAMMAELIYTAMLVFTVLNTAVSKMHKGKNEYYGLAIGFTVIAGGHAVGSISGACLNPAVAWGIDISSARLGFGWCFPYLVAELIGAALAAGLFVACRPEELANREPPRACYYGLQSQLLSEFIGTFMLVLTVGLNVLGKSSAAVWSIAACLTSMIFSLGTCSGAHFNPAVTLAICRRGGIDASKARWYVAVQIFAGITAGFSYSAMQRAAFPIGPAAGLDWWLKAYLGELVFTFLLAYVVLSVTMKTDSKLGVGNFSGLAIGSCVTAGGHAIGALSGGSLNPAVSLGVGLPALFQGHGLLHAFVYCIFELLGGLLAAYVFSFTHETDVFPPAVHNGDD